ncbi:MAG: tRNA1(Val) (adenine(37)-N6)-methyltransferase [Faecousia sp.]
MEYLPHGFQLDIPPGCFPLTTDSMVLAHFAGDPGAGPVLDLGAGCGTLGLLLCARSERCHVTGVELDAAAHHGALENIRRNGLGQRMESICADLRRVPGLFAPGSFACCISNPPYFSGGPASFTPSARREDQCTLADLMKAAAWALKFGGDFFLVHRPERLGEIIALGAENALEAKQLTLVRHREDGPVALVLLKLRKGARPGLTMEEWVLHHRDGSPTNLYREIYHIRED